MGAGGGASPHGPEHTVDYLGLDHRQVDVRLLHAIMHQSVDVRLLHAITLPTLHQSLDVGLRSPGGWSG